MRYLTVVSDLGSRGTQRVAQNYSIAMADRGHEVAVLAIKEGGIREAPLAQKKIPIWIGGANLNEALAKAQIFEADVIHVHRPGMNQRCWTPVLQKLKASGGRILETNVFGRVDYSPDASFIDVHLQISKWSLYRWRKWLGRRNQIGVYLPNAVDMDSFPKTNAFGRPIARNSFNLPSSSFICGRIGKWRPCMFDAFKVLLRHCPDALMLSVADHADVQHYIDHLPVDIQRKIATIPSAKSDDALVRFYSSIDCLLQVAPGGESFGMVLAESMACGSPVVTASTPHKDNAQVELVQHGKGGVVAGSSAKLGAALVAFYADRIMQKTCSSESRSLIADRYDVKHVITRLEIIAKYAIESKGNKDILVDLLRSDERMEMDIDYKEIEKLLYNTLSGPNILELALMRLVHNPLIYRGYSHFVHGY